MVSETQDSYRHLKHALAEQARELDAAREQQAAVSGILKAISSSTFELQPILEELAGNATRLCRADWALVYRFDGTFLRSAAYYGAPRELIDSNLGREAVELDCDPREELRCLDGGTLVRQRLRAGRRLIVFADDAAPVVERIDAADRGDRRPLVVRPSNLEDVFLHLTGTTLEESV